MNKITVGCPRCDGSLEPGSSLGSTTMWRCSGCGFAATGGRGYIDLVGSAGNPTGEHYSLQWGEDLGYLEFVRKNPAVKAVMPAGQLGWDEMIEEIRRMSAARPIHVYDAACGFGGIASDLLTDGTAAHLVYLGADVHEALPLIAESIPRFGERGLLLRWDIARPLPVRETFDYVLCRASLHHTPDPPRTFALLCRALKPGGKIAVSVYRRKGVCREAIDDALRGLITRLPRDEAFATCRQFTVLGQVLQRVGQEIDIPEDLPLLGIPKGRISVHALVYYHLLKCFYNPVFGDRYSTLVNYDWYHPPHAHRYDVDEVQQWFEENRIEVIDVRSIEVQHYLAGVKSSE